ncbi:hypothetical protein MTO96_021193 [Rhipicephalus appendiculatus]
MVVVATPLLESENPKGDLLGRVREPESQASSIRLRWIVFSRLLRIPKAAASAQRRPQADIAYVHCPASGLPGRGHSLDRAARVTVPPEHPRSSRFICLTSDAALTGDAPFRHVRGGNVQSGVDPVVRSDRSALSWPQVFGDRASLRETLSFRRPWCGVVDGTRRAVNSSSRPWDAVYVCTPARRGAHVFPRCATRFAGRDRASSESR